MLYILVAAADSASRPEHDTSLPSWPYRSIPSAAQDCLAYGLQKLAHDVGGSGVLLIQDLLWLSRISELSEYLLHGLATPVVG